MTNIENFNPENLLSARIGRLSRSEALDLGMKLCAELSLFSADGEFHGRVRPDNISVEGEEVTLGPSTEQPEELGASELEYISPEQFWDGSKNPVCDLYSLGLVLYAACSGGRLPFVPELGEYSPEDRANALRRRMQGAPPAPPAAAGEKFGAVIVKAISFSAEKRYKNAEEMLRALRACPISEPPITPRAAVPAAPAVAAAPAREYKVDKEFEATEPIKPRKKKERRLKSGAVIGIFLAVAAIAAVALIFNIGGAGRPPEAAAPPESAVIASPGAVQTPAPPPTPSATPAPEETPAPTQDPEEFDEPQDVVRYEVVLSNLSWEEAAQRCEEMGGRLATVSGRSELDEITALCESAGAAYVWLGAYRGDGDRWTWVTGEEVEFFDWAGGEPSYFDTDGSQENFLLLWKVSFGGQSGWKYNDCRENPAAAYPGIFSGKLAFVCEYDF